ncbi:inositol monophosphatase family protein [Ectothiorhodospira sp. BSL-9]|uniref:inositol monophosphatase family protein n=1 Tax=Ectothiorhodospira sp. BSL-9 TaxID=1442136 RepID=UPI0007B42548|nr:inositol monophosphatase family protein [Ectothiorhodospira sp. BSL-9]ANB03483.1 inositol monophosphatase [Ectothiorhodospira sp. BSL-9]
MADHSHTIQSLDWHSITQGVCQRVNQILNQADRSGRLKTDGSWVTDTDIAIQRQLQDWLAEIHPGIGFLGEEMTPQAQQGTLKSDRPAWVLDPLDGTSNFRAGLPAYATALALMENGRVVFGLVHDPCRRETFTAVRGEGAWLNGERLTIDPADVPELSRAIAAVDFKRLPRPMAINLATEPPYASQRSIGSVALEWCWVAAGRFAVYVHGKQNLWDYAAGQLILTEAGGHHTTLPGQAPAALDLQPRSAVCAMSRELLDAWEQALQA